MTSSVALSYDRSVYFKPIWLRRLIWVLAILVLLQSVYWLFGERVSNRLLLLFWQRQCLNYSQPAGRVMYVYAPPNAQLPPHLANCTPKLFSAHYTAGAMPYPIEFSELQARLSGQSTFLWQQMASPVFLHRLKDANGVEKLVSVYVLADNPNGWWTVCTVVRDLATLTDDPAPPKLSTATWPMPTGQTQFAVFSGQPDGKDASKFGLSVQINGEKIDLSATLKASGEVDVSSSTGLEPASRKHTGDINLQPRASVIKEEDLCGAIMPTDDTP